MARTRVPFILGSLLHQDGASGPRGNLSRGSGHSNRGLPMPGYGANSRMNTSPVWLASPATRFVAAEKKATAPPLALMAGRELESLACVPSEATLALTVVPVWRSCTNTSWPHSGFLLPLLSLGTRLLSSEMKAT